MKRRFITVQQLSENSLTSLIPKEIRVVRELKKVVPVNEWNSIQSMCASYFGLTESEDVTDDQIADMLLKASKEIKGLNVKNVKDIDLDLDAMAKGEEDAIEIKKEYKQPLQESLTLALILGAPTILNILAKILDWVYRFFALNKEEKIKYQEEAAAYQYAKKTGKLPDGTKVTAEDLHKLEDDLFKSKAGEFIKNLGHKLHDKYVAPIRGLIAGLMWMYKGNKKSMLQCWKEAQRPAEIIYAVVMLGVAGYGAVHSILSIPSAAAAISSIGGITNLATAVTDATKGGEMTSKIIKSVLSYVHI